MNQPRVSVLVTFYNQEKYVDKAIKSILEQKTTFDLKILIGDDGSSDGTQERIAEWVGRYPQTAEYFVMKREPGRQYVGGFRASQNRLNLLKHVNTEYFIFLDGDDYFDCQDKLQQQVDILDREENKDCIACGHNVDMLYPDGKRVGITSRKIKEGKYTASQYWQGMYFHTDSLLVRSNVISTIPMELLENHFNDNMITFSVIQKGKIYYIPKSWAIYLQTGDGIWTSGKQAENEIRNMCLYDLCNQINPKMKRQTDYRFADTWKRLLKIRKCIDLANYDVFDEEAKEKKLQSVEHWLHYKKMKLHEKQILCLTAFWIIIRMLKERLFMKVYRIILGD